MVWSGLCSKDGKEKMSIWEFFKDKDSEDWPLLIASSIWNSQMCSYTPWHYVAHTIWEAIKKHWKLIMEKENESIKAIFEPFFPSQVEAVNIQ